MFRLRRIYFSSISEGIWNHSLLFSLFFCSSSSVSLPYYISFPVSLKTFIFCFLLTGPLCFVKLVVTAFYSPELPFMFYRCQQLAAHLKCYHFTVTNCHHLHYSLDVTCAWSPRNLCMNCSIYTMSLFLSLSSISILFTQKLIPAILYNNCWGRSYCMSIILWRVLSSVLWIRKRCGFIHKDKSAGSNLAAQPQSQLTGSAKIIFPESFVICFFLTMCTFSRSLRL